MRSEVRVLYRPPNCADLRRASRRSVPELAHELLERACHTVQVAHRVVARDNTLGGVLRRIGDTDDVLRDLGHALGGLADAATDFRRGGRLLLDRARDARLERADPT